jgi:sulfotransferase family protein
MIERQRPSIATDGRNQLGFLIVGTPRSGTTLVQRLASELPGVRVPPETHFFPHFGVDLIHRRTFPLDGTGIEQEVRRFTALKTSRGMDLDPAQVATDLDGRCSSALDLFQAIVRSLAGPAEVYGEKTPNHLLWWRPLSRALPRLRLIAVVRDPRAVTSSYASAPFGMDSSAALAESWVADQREVLAASVGLGARRCLIVRYEDVVEDPERAVESIRGFLDRPPIDDAPPPGARTQPSILMPWETWKLDALGPVVKNRVDAWRTELSPRDIARVTAICGPRMRAFGYEDSASQRRRDVYHRRTLSPIDQWRRWHFKLARSRRMRTINSTPV